MVVVAEGGKRAVEEDRDRCSVLVKAVPGAGDVLVAHTTFDYYAAAWQRMIKDVALPVLSPHSSSSETTTQQQQQQQQQQPGGQQWTRQCYSASAGQLASLDDFYLVRGEVRALLCAGAGAGAAGVRMPGGFISHLSIYQSTH